MPGTFACIFGGLALVASPGMALVRPAHTPPIAPPPPAQALPTIDLWGDFPKVDVNLPFVPLEDAWPSRVGAGTGVIVEANGPTLRPEGFRVGFVFPPRSPAEVPDALALLGTADAEGELRILTEGEGAFVVRVDPRPPGPVARRRLNTADLTFRFVSAQPEPDGAIRLERTWFSYFAPILPSDRPDRTPKAIVLLMPGMFGTPEGVLIGLTTHMRSRGYGVLRMIAQPGRFTERLTLRLDAAVDFEPEVKRMTAVFDSREAECAYATEAAFEHLASVRPETRGLPRIAIGFSAGAITLPTVVAREPSAYSAAVLVGGGCHWWLLNERSNYRGMIDAVEVVWTELPTDAALARAGDIYLANSRLDPFNTAQVLRDVPTLVIQGLSDLAVPSPLGDALWERLGKPERWLMEGGHEVLFMQLPNSFERIGAWIDQRLGAKDEGLESGPGIGAE